MGTGGPGNIVHIDNLYVKTFNVQDDVNIVLGEFVVIEDDGGKAIARPLTDSDFSGADLFLDLSTVNIVQADEDANNLATTDPLLRKGQIECITKGSDWTVVMRAGVLPDSPVGILRVGTAELFEVSYLDIDTPSVVAANERLGIYKHKEFSTVAEVSVQDDNGIISTGVGLS
jgi:hypothetical protein